MKALKFIFFPLIVLLINEIIQMVVVGFIFGQEPHSFFGHASSFFVYLVFGSAIYMSAPGKSLLLSYIYALLFLALMLFLAVYTDGAPNFMDKSQIVEISLVAEAIMVIGTILGIHAIRFSEAEQDG